MDSRERLTDRCRRLRRDPFAVGVTGIVLVFVALSVLTSLAVPLFRPVDEAAHYAYAAELIEGHLPTIETHLDANGIRVLEQLMNGRDAAHSVVWTANHPPLHYLLIALPIGAGHLVGLPEVGVHLARILGVLLSALSLVGIGLLARRLFPGHVRVPLLAVAAAAAVPTFVNVSSVLYNDSTATLLTVTLLLIGLHALRGGWSRGVVLALAVASALAMLTRASSALPVAVATGMVLVGVWRGEPAVRIRLRRAAIVAVTVPVSVAATSGWFWWRNHRLYGSFTAESALLEHFNRRPKARSTIELLTSRDYWLRLHQRLWDLGFDFPANRASLTRFLWLVVGIPFALLVVGIARSRGGVLRERIDAATRWWFAGGVLLGLGLMVTTARFASVGGAAHARYLLAALPVVAVLAGKLVSTGIRSGWIVTAVVLAAVATNLIGLASMLHGTFGGAPGLHQIWKGLAVSEITGVGRVAVVVVLAAIVVAGLRLVWRATMPSEPALQPASSAQSADEVTASA